MGMKKLFTFLLFFATAQIAYCQQYSKLPKKTSLSSYYLVGVADTANLYGTGQQLYAVRLDTLEKWLIATAGLGSMSKADSVSFHGNPNIVTVGTITTGVWSGTSIDTSKTNAVSNVVGVSPISVATSGKTKFVSCPTCGTSTGTVTSVATGYGLSGGTITTTGTLRADTARKSGLPTYFYADSIAATKGAGTVTSITTSNGITGGTITTTGNLRLNKTAIDSVGTLVLGTIGVGFTAIDTARTNATSNVVGIAPISVATSGKTKFVSADTSSGPTHLATQNYVLSHAGASCPDTCDIIKVNNLTIQSTNDISIVGANVYTTTDNGLQSATWQMLNGSYMFAQIDSFLINDLTNSHTLTQKWDTDSSCFRIYSPTGDTVTLPNKIKYQDGTQASGNVLTSDANGLASWSSTPILSGYITVNGSVDYADCVRQFWPCGFGSGVYVGNGFVSASSSGDSTVIGIGTFSMSTGAASGYVLRSDANGAATWQQNIFDTTVCYSHANIDSVLACSPLVLQGTYVRINAPIATSYQYETPSTGATVNADGSSLLVVNPSGALVALTVNFPSSPTQGQIFQMAFTQNITTVTLGNATILGGIVAAALNASYKYQYVSEISKWIRLQ